MSGHGQEARNYSPPPAIWASIHGRIPDGCATIREAQEAALAEWAALVAERDEANKTAGEMLARIGRLADEADRAHDRAEQAVAERDAANEAHALSVEAGLLFESALAQAVAERDSLQQIIDSQEFRKECADTPLMRDVMAERDRYRDALETYADARHWAIRRNETRYPDCIWIGPGAEETVPNAPGVARAALAAGESE